MSPRAAVLQMNSTDDLEHNLAKAAALLQQAADAGAALAQLPENFALMAEKEADKLAIAEADGCGRIQDFLAEIAARLGLWIVAGTLPITAADGRAFAASCVYDASGTRRARYDKIHLFDVDVGEGERYQESRSIAPGRPCPVVVDTPVGRLGLAVCYDLRFPELFRALLDQGATVFSLPAAFTATTGALHWHCLLKARAVENQCFVLASGQVGSHPGGRSTYGHSLAYGPWGDLLTDAGPSTPGVAIAPLDHQALAAVRARFPALRHRQLTPAPP
jgi:nitrilase